MHSLNQAVRCGYRIVFRSFTLLVKLWLDALKNNITHDFSPLMSDLFDTVHPYKIASIIQMLISRLVSNNTPTAYKGIIIKALSRVAIAFPNQTVWWLFPLMFFMPINENKQQPNVRKDIAEKILNVVKATHRQRWDYFQEAMKQYQMILELQSNLPHNYKEERYSHYQLKMPFVSKFK